MFAALLARSILLQMTKAFYVSLQQIITDIEHSVERITQVVAQRILLKSTEKKREPNLAKKITNGTHDFTETCNFSKTYAKDLNEFETSSAVIGVKLILRKFLSSLLNVECLMLILPYLLSFVKPFK